MTHDLSLDTIGLKHGTDKASLFHNYLHFYDRFFAPMRYGNLKVLEIGILGGASLATWKDYFPSAQIVGADIKPTMQRFAQDRVAVEILDQSNIEQLVSMAVKHGPFDIIIEDGSHLWEHQITSLRTLFPFVQPEGIYIVEDLQTNYGALGKRYRGAASESCVEYLKKWLDLRVADSQVDIAKVEDPFLRTYGQSIEFIAFHKRACLIKKQMLSDGQVQNVGKPLAHGYDGHNAETVFLSAHIGLQGDIFGSNGFVNTGSGRAVFQGFAIQSGPGALEYRVRCDHEWSDWTVDGRFVGTRGKNKAVTGVTVRLREDRRGEFTLRVFCRFAGSDAAISVFDGEDCVSPDGAPLCGLQIGLSHP